MEKQENVIRMERNRQPNRYVTKKKEAKPRDEYMGSIITAANRNEFEKQQIEAYLQNYERITDEDKKLPEDEVLEMAKMYARFQSNKEKKHYEAWLEGKRNYKYKKMIFPVLTKPLIESMRKQKEIITNEQGINND